MPRRTRSRKSRKSTRGAPRKKRVSFSKNNTVTTVVKNNIADRTLCKMKYAAAIQLTATGSAKLWIVRGNSLYDPDYSTGAVNEQPSSFTQWQGFYSYYRVLGAALTVEAVSGTTTPQVIAIKASRGVPSEIDYKDFITDPYSKYKVITSSAGGAPTKLNMYMPSRKILGLTQAQYDDEDYRASVNANPASEWYFSVAVDTLPTAGNPDVTVLYTLTYYVELSGRKDLSLS